MVQENRSLLNAVENRRIIMFEHVIRRDSFVKIIIETNIK